MEEEVNLAEDFGASGTVAPEVQIQQPAPVEQPLATEQASPQERESHRIPLSEHLSVRDRAQKAERDNDELRRQLQAFQQQSRPETKPAFDWDKPEEYVRQQAHDTARQAINPIQQSLMYNNKLIAQSVLGKDVVAAAEKAFDEDLAAGRIDPVTYQRVTNHPNPWHAAHEWYSQRQILEKTGGDLTAYEQRVLEEKLKDPEFLARAVEAHQSMQQQSRQPNGQFANKPTTLIRPATSAPSLNRATGSSNASAGDVDDEGDLAAAFGAR